MNASSLVRRLSASGLEGEMILPGDPRYDGARCVWNGTADRRPEVIVRARSCADVRRTIDAVASDGAPLAIRCGGHSLPGLSTCDGGVVLDLGLMNGITVDPRARTARVSGGALLGDLDRAGASFGLVVPAGVVSHTGATGLTLGGGMGWLSRRFGLTIDSLMDADLITADGTAVHASAEEEPELFWGIRGGGGNFGVVTSLTFRMHELGPITTGRWTYPRDSVEVALRAYRKLAAEVPRDLSTAFTVTVDGLTVSAFHCGDLQSAGSAIRRFGQLARGGEGEHGLTDFLAFQSRSDEHFRWGRRYYAKGGFLHDLSDDAIAAMIGAAGSSPTVHTEIYTLQLGGAVSDLSDESAAYTGRAANYYWIVEPVWDDPADDARCIAWGRNTAARLASVSMSGNYVNEQADLGGDVARQAYGAEKFRRLQRLKARFDPGNLFRLNQNIEPLP
ncbi:FAD-binding oxidoreductase [Aestuariivirga sp.]|uniref:FAD-binding oxidoreductase n=1 Tax=Aestuariivirga sp. TaxID=2650926 RepID=UPI00391BC77D